MRMAPDDHPERSFFSHWPASVDAFKVWRYVCRQGGHALSEELARCQVVSWPRFDWHNPYHTCLEVVYFPQRGAIGWVNFARRKCCPSPEFLDAPLLCTLSLNCDAPVLYKRFFLEMDWANGPLEAHNRFGITLFRKEGKRRRHGILWPQHPTFDLIRHPRCRLRLHVHHTEMVAWAAQAARWIRAWQEGKPGPLDAFLPEQAPFERLREGPVPEFYSPLAGRVLAAWNTLLQAVGPRDFGAVARRATGRKRRISGEDP